MYFCITLKTLWLYYLRVITFVPDLYCTFSKHSTEAVRSKYFVLPVIIIYIDVAALVTVEKGAVIILSISYG